ETSELGTSEVEEFILPESVRLSMTMLELEREVRDATGDLPDPTSWPADRLFVPDHLLSILRGRHFGVGSRPFCLRVIYVSQEQAGPGSVLVCFEPSVQAIRLPIFCLQSLLCRLGHRGGMCRVTVIHCISDGV
ncbi:hypothetical protein XENOCAPTIV_014044, partial [Xenoophorus captivus]